MENETYSLTTCSYTASLHLLFVIFWLTGTHSHKNPILEEEKSGKEGGECGKNLCEYQDEKRRKEGGAQLKLNLAEGMWGRCCFNFVLVTTQTYFN